MRIHSDILTSLDISAAERAAGMTGVDATVTAHGSRKRDHAFNVLLTGTSSRRPNNGRYGADSNAFAATWDEWGMFLAALYAVDPNMDATYYADAADFHRQTGDRFLTLKAADQCRNHNWGFVISLSGHECSKCAARRFR